MSNEDLKLYDKGSRIGVNNIEIRCICTKKLLMVRADPSDAKVTLELRCTKMILTCECGKVHEIENRAWEDAQPK